ncbi:MAG: hypothetical protein PHF60_02065 [Candidatus ainarchaeum sp.]|nr:hypothetical protein [Candidatus ainarchaeum sp.]
MDDRGPGPNLAFLAMDARHHADASIRLSAGKSLVELYVGAGNYKALIAMASDDYFLQEVREIAKKNIVAAANESGHEALHDVAARPDLPESIKREAASLLFDYYSDNLDSEGIMRLASDERILYEVRIMAGMRLIDWSAGARRLDELLGYVKTPKLPYEIRKMASESLINLAVLANNYPILLRLSTEDGVPINIRLAADEKVESVALSAIKDAHKRADAPLLRDMAADKRLSSSARGQAETALASITKSSMPPIPTAEMAADALRLSRSKVPMAVPRPSSRPPMAIPRSSSGQGKPNG